MGQKVYFNGICLGIVKLWNFIWFVNIKEFVDNLDSDFKVCQYLIKELVKVFVFCIVIECLVKSICVIIYIVCLGIVIGKKGEDVEKLCKVVVDIVGVFVQINIVEVCKFELDVKLVVDSIIFQLECCVMFCCVMKCVVQNVMCLGVKGIKVEVSGCLGGVEIVCIEWYCEGCVLLYILCVDIDYNIFEVYIIYGVIGVKVWIFKGEILGGMAVVE